VYLLPDRNLGLAVLTNQESGNAFEAITYFIVDHYLQPPKTDWLAAYQAVQARALKTLADAERRSAAKRNEESSPSLLLSAYAGRYNDAWYGRHRGHACGRSTLVALHEDADTVW